MFPGVSASWRISQENFLKNSKVFNELKLSASYGQTGNQEGIRLYDYIQLLKFRDDGWGTKLIYPFGNGSQSQAMGLDVLAGVDRTWEILENVNVGVDAAFLDSRLGFSFDYFVKMNNNMLIPVTYPSMLGAEAPYSNSGKLRTNGFELTLNWTDKIGNVEYSAQFQLTDAVNKLVEYGGADTYKLGLNETREGYPMNSYFAYVYDGVIKDQADLDAYKKLEGVPSNIGIGDAKFKDLNGDGKISTYGDKDGDDGDAEYVGSTTPRYSFGLNLGAKWNNFDISVFFQGVAKRTLERLVEIPASVLLRPDMERGSPGRLLSPLDAWRNPALELSGIHPAKDQRSLHSPKEYPDRLHAPQRRVTETRHRTDTLLRKRTGSIRDT